jgi:hypothetical protein
MKTLAIDGDKKCRGNTQTFSSFKRENKAAIALSHDSTHIILKKFTCFFKTWKMYLSIIPKSIRYFISNQLVSTRRKKGTCLHTKSFINEPLLGLFFTAPRKNSCKQLSFHFPTEM